MDHRGADKDRWERGFGILDEWDLNQLFKRLSLFSFLFAHLVFFLSKKRKKREKKKSQVSRLDSVRGSVWVTDCKMKLSDHDST
jgi:hypothetical protein